MAKNSKAKPEAKESKQIKSPEKDFAPLEPDSLEMQQALEDAWNETSKEIEDMEFYAEEDRVMAAKEDFYSDQQEQYEEQKIEIGVGVGTIDPSSDPVSTKEGTLLPETSEERAVFNKLNDALLGESSNPDSDINGQIILNEGASPQDVANGIKTNDLSVINKGHRISDIKRLGLDKEFGVNFDDVSDDSILIKEKNGSFSIESPEEVESKGKKILNEKDPEYENLSDEAKKILEEERQKEALAKRTPQSIGGMLAASAMNSIRKMFSPPSDSKQNNIPMKKNDASEKLSKNVSQKGEVLMSSVEDFSDAHDDIKKTFKNNDDQGALYRLSQVGEDELPDAMSKLGMDDNQIEKYNKLREKSKALLKSKDDFDVVSEEAEKRISKNSSSESSKKLANAVDSSNKKVVEMAKEKNIEEKIKDDKNLAEKMSEIIEKLVKSLKGMVGGNSPKPK